VVICGGDVRCKFWRGGSDVNAWKFDSPLSGRGAGSLEDPSV
jgi:hypothetical protein